MKNVYLKPDTKVIDIEFNTIIMAASTVDTGMSNTPVRPDARERRGEWGDLW